MSDDFVYRPRCLGVVHGFAAILAVAVFVMRDIDSPDIGFPIAIAILAGLGIRSSPKPACEEMLRLAHGGILRGGIRQGVFIKAMFAVALLYLGAIQFLQAPTTAGITNLLLGVSLGLSGLASELEAWELRRAIRTAE